MTVKLRSGTYKYIESILRSYHDYEQYIYLREQELLNPHKDCDTNVGGGRGNAISDPTRIKASRLVEDRKVQVLKAEKQAVEKALASVDDVSKEIIVLWYLKKPRLVTWDGVANKVHLSRSQCIRRRDNFISLIADELGLK
ncbi:RinA family phage transcriptional regulator [Facklamia hominis]|uniref:RinA family phage transcriptional regulator n=1 Tax=Facklamia hominis CCUG 36813 TaxID=883111 RepID=K1LCW6_9LACT|nr:RinA family phage transcriptional regulator [Facklamia hominis]EKB54480.1 RinA family phage transcriptional regulator [Facklamia hominis CCUG 36813]